ncbi:MAG: DNA-processing protein DprA, partial [Actinomycetes bacterium]
MPATPPPFPVPEPTPAHVAAAALAALPEMTPARLRNLVAVTGSPVAAARAVAAGRAAAVLAPHTAVRHRERLGLDAARWTHRLDLVATRAQLTERGTRVWLAGESGFPVLDPLPHLPSVLLAEGDRPDALDSPRVAIVGTRAATPNGLADARELAGVLADAGAVVVSGLALGIDGAAHAGAVAAGGTTIGVVATGLDVEYPRRHHDLYRAVRAHGLVMGESGYGVRPSPVRFPVRNRIIAALADIVVVVEATLTGG